jgi:hypothetical protein
MDTKRNPTPITEPKPKIAINFNRKILDHKTLQTLKDTLASQGMVSGQAIDAVVDDLIKLRYLCENVVDVYIQGNKDNALRGLEMLRLVL